MLAEQLSWKKILIFFVIDSVWEACFLSCKGIAEGSDQRTCCLTWLLHCAGFLWLSLPHTCSRTCMWLPSTGWHCTWCPSACNANAQRLRKQRTPKHHKPFAQNQTTWKIWPAYPITTFPYQVFFFIIGIWGITFPYQVVAIVFFYYRDLRHNVSFLFLL